MAARYVLSVVVALSVAIMLLVVVGCSETPESNPENKGSPETPSQQPAEKTLRITHTVSADTEYYLSGPQQGRPPDGTLKAGTEVELISESGSYALVRSMSGVEAHVSTAALKPTGPSFPTQ